MRNTDPHQKYSSSRPPINGPMAPPAEKLAIQTPIALLRSSGCGNRLLTIDSVEGASVAAASPINARAAIIIGAELAKAAISDAAPNANAPHRSSRRRPIRSPKTPMGISAAARMNPYMSTIHNSWAGLGSRSVASSGTARFSTVRSIEYNRQAERGSPSPAIRAARPGANRRALPSSPPWRA
jgi:hypothetical protein